MARKRMVTRSFYTTHVKAIAFNDESNKTGEIEETLTGSFKDEKAALKALTALYESNEKITPIKIISMEEDSALYGIEETEFLKVAKKLENRNNKVSEEADSETAE